MKITVFGDIMCEPPILQASRKADGSYDFSDVYSKVRPMFEEADYVIANLEFPVAGEAAGYTDDFYVFNGPDAFAQATKDAGVDLVATVNNHTLDRGVEGMLRTLKALDEIGLDHTGTYASAQDRQEAFYFEKDGVKFAVIAYTYSTNKKLPDDDPYVGCINLLRNMRMPAYTPEVRAKMQNWVDKLFPKLKRETRSRIKLCLGMPGTIPRPDDLMDMEKIEPYMKNFVADIRAAKEKADVVVCCPHTGGQFNVEPGKFSEYVVDEAVKAGADVVLASHSHMVQKACFAGDVLCAYSLGNFSMSPNSAITVKEHLPEYGLAMHLYYDGKKLEKVTFSILKAIEKRGKQLISWPVDVLYDSLNSNREKQRLEKHIRQIYKYVTLKELTGDVVRKEYELEK